MNNPWVLCGIGILFCCSGVILFFKKVYEDGQSVKWPLIIMIMGIMLIAAGTAKYFLLKEPGTKSQEPNKVQIGK